MILTRRPVVWPPVGLEERIRFWLPKTFSGGEWARQPTHDLEAVSARIRLAPFGDHVGLWWHENPERRPIEVFPVDPDELAEDLEAVAETADHYDHPDDPFVEEWIESLADVVVGAVELKVYSGDREGMGGAVGLAFSMAYAELCNGIIGDRDRWYELGDPLVLRARHIG